MAPEPTPDLTPPETIEIAKADFDQLKTVAQSLADEVKQMKDGLVDRDTVERIVEDLIETQDRAQANGRRSFRPSNQSLERAAGQLHGKTGKELLQAIQAMPVAEVAALTKIPAEEIGVVHQAADRALFLAAALGKPVRELKFYEQTVKPLVQALNTGGSGDGEEWIPTQLSPDLIDRVELQRKVLGLFPSITMPTNPFNIPGRAVARTRLAQGLEQSADTGQTGFKKIQIGSRKVTMTAAKFDGEALVSREEEEDAIIAVLPLMEDELGRFIAYDMEDAALNGDTAGTQDSDFAADDPRLNWDGLRKLALAGTAKTNFAGAKLTVSGLRANRKAMGKYGVDPATLAHILSVNEYIDVLDDTAVLTLEKYGPQATVLRGELGSVDSIPLIVSEAARVDLTTAGVFDNVTKTRTAAVTVYRNGFANGSRRELTIQVLRELYAEYDQDAVLISIRRAFTPLYPASTEHTVAILYNVNI